MSVDSAVSNQVTKVKNVEITARDYLPHVSGEIR